jgi:hypothetical protein
MCCAFDSIALCAASLAHGRSGTVAFASIVMAAVLLALMAHLISLLELPRTC